MKKNKPFTSIYNLIAVGQEGNQLFGRYVDNKKQAKSEIIGHSWFSKINHVRLNGKIYTLKEVLTW